MKLRVLLEGEKLVPLKQRLLKFQQDLIDVCDDVSPIDIYKIPRSENSVHGRTFDRYVFIVTPEVKDEAEAQYAIFIDDEGDDLVCAGVYLDKKDNAEVTVDSTTVKTLKGLRRIFDFDEMSTGRQEGLERVITWLSTS